MTIMLDTDDVGVGAGAMAPAFVDTSPTPRTLMGFHLPPVPTRWEQLQ
jgi:hypothetical protein